MAELAFEGLYLALEATRGTAVTPPTHVVPLAGTISPAVDVYRPAESRGVLAMTTRSAVTRRRADWQAEGGLEVNVLPVLLNMALEAGVAPSTPGGATTTRLWTFERAMTTNALKTATLYWGDPNVAVFQAAYALLQEMEISADGTGTDGTMISVSGVAAFPADVVAPTFPAALESSMIVPMDFQVWLDTGSDAIGTTEIEGRVLSVTHTIPSGLKPKFVPSGPTGNRTINRLGVAKTSPTTRVVMELLDLDQYDLFQDETPVKLRVRHNGALIEGSLYEFVEVDGYGLLTLGAPWGDYEGTNRTIEFELVHEYNADIGTDIIVRVQNERAAL